MKDFVAEGIAAEKESQERWREQGKGMAVAGAEVQLAARRLVHSGKAKDQAAALDMIRAENPKLWTRYVTGR